MDEIKTNCYVVFIIQILIAVGSLAGIILIMFLKRIRSALIMSVLVKGAKAFGDVQVGPESIIPETNGPLIYIEGLEGTTKWVIIILFCILVIGISWGCCRCLQKCGKRQFGIRI